MSKSGIPGSLIDPTSQNDIGGMVTGLGFGSGAVYSIPPAGVESGEGVIVPHIGLISEEYAYDPSAIFERTMFVQASSDVAPDGEVVTGYFNRTGKMIKSGWWVNAVGSGGGGGSVTYAQLTLPAIFDWFTHKLYADNTTDYHPDLYRPTGKTYYVKPAAQGGNDSNDGLTWATALATPITAARKADCVIVQLAAGRYPSAFWGDTPSFGAAFRGMACDDGVAEFLASALDNSANFAPDGANPGAYKWTGAGTVYGVWDESSPNSFGGWGWLTRRTTAADVASLGGWYSNGTDLWVRLTGGRAPDASVRVNRIRRCNNGRSSISLWFKGINFHGGSMVVNAAGTAMTIHYYNCLFGYAGTSDDASTLNVGSTTSYTYYYNCKAYHSEKDLFSAQGANRSFEYRCEAYDTPIAGANNGTTAHGTCNVISVDSYYHDTAGRVVADVSTGGNSGRLLLGCIARNSPGVGSADFSSTGSPMYMINCRNYGSITGVGMDGNGAKYWQNTELTNGFINATPTAVELYTGPGVTPTLADWGAE